MPVTSRKNPPSDWFAKREASAKDYEDAGETDAAKEYRKETADVATGYVAGDIDAYIKIAEDLCDGTLTNEQKEALRITLAE